MKKVSKIKQTARTDIAQGEHITKEPFLVNLPSVKSAPKEEILEKMSMNPACQEAVRKAPSLRCLSSDLFCMTDRQFEYVTRELWHAKIEQPKWLRKKFRNTINRRALIKKLLIQGGLDDSWCDSFQDNQHWSNEIHLVWHAIELTHRLSKMDGEQ